MVDSVLSKEARMPGTAESRDSSFDWEAKLHVCIRSDKYTAVFSSSSDGFWASRYSLRIESRTMLSLSDAAKPSKNLLKDCVPVLRSIKVSFKVSCALTVLQTALVLIESQKLLQLSCRSNFLKRAGAFGNARYFLALKIGLITIFGILRGSFGHC